MSSAARNPHLHCVFGAILPPLALMAGCANPGPPHPPSLHLPAVATGLSAERIGEGVHLAWNTSDKTSDGIINAAPIMAVICREPIPALHRSANAAPCNPVLRVPVRPGQTQATDPLPLVLQQGHPHLLAYRIELLNSRDRSAGLSSQILAVAGTAPTDPGPIRITASARGALIEWTPLPIASTSLMQLTRTPAAAIVPPAVHTRPKNIAGLPTFTKTNSDSPVLLQAPAGSDPGGLLDSSLLPETAYTYIAQRLQTVTLGGSTYELRSDESPPVTFAYHDTFPPDPPSGLESIPSAPLSGPASIDLSWNSSPDTAVTGYNVYRSEAPSNAFRRLNVDSIPGVSFHDLTAQPGHTYRYKVTALNHAGNESSPSPEISEAIRTP